VREIEQFRTEIRREAKWFQTLKPRTVLLHHNDTDGLTSGAILQKAITREGKALNRYCLEKPYPKVLERLFDSSDQGTLFLFADFASGMLPTISKINRAKHYILVLDHHLIDPVSDHSIHLLNGLSAGLSNVHFSSSTLAFEFACALNSWNEDLSWLGALGALGDGFLSSGKLIGMNGDTWSRACALKKAAHPYTFLLEGRYDYRELKDALDSLGSIGYFRGGPDVAVKALSDRIDEGFWQIAAKYQREKIEGFEELKSKLKINMLGKVQWFDSGMKFFDFGVKTIGLFCEELLTSDLIEPQKYLVGFQRLREEIPGLGKFSFGESKLSIRVPDLLAKQIETGNQPPVTKLLPAVVDALSGFLDACHPTAGAATIPVGREEEFVRKLAEALG